MSAPLQLGEMTDPRLLWSVALWSRVSFVPGQGPGGDCWEWQGCKGTSGYGRLQVLGRSEGAHRIAYWLYTGLLPFVGWVLHHCDNPPCVNPRHLFEGTAFANTQDMIAKGRAAWQKKAAR